jgi:acyl-CoA thioesterase
MTVIGSTSDSPLGDHGASAFERHTAVERSGHESFRTQIAPEVSAFGGAAHSGYVGAIALRVLGEAAAGRPPRSISLQLLSRIVPGSVELHRRLDRDGTSMSSASLDFERGDTRLATARAIFGDGHESLDLRPIHVPDVPGVEECVPTPAADKPAQEGEVVRLVERRPAGSLPQADSKDGRLLIWVRLVEERPLDALSVTVLADAAPPALYAALDRFVPMPSAELAVLFHAGTVAGPWLLADLRTLAVGGGWASESGDFWAQDGTLVATSRQLRRIFEPRT